MALNGSANHGRPDAAPRRVGLFGGSFDPPHLAHLALAQSACRDLSLDELLWLPVGQPWQKTGRVLAANEHRLAMLGLLMAAGSATASTWTLDDGELRRAGPSYTLDTVQARLSAHPGESLFLIIGQDQYARLHTWHEWPRLLAQVTLAVAARADQEAQASAEVEAMPHLMVRLNMPAMDISSTRVRELASRGEDIRPLVGDAVAGYIAQHRLYGAPSPQERVLNGHP